MSKGVKLASALIALGFHPRAAARAAGVILPPLPELFDDGRYADIPDDPIEFDHDPCLATRPNEPWRGILANDPRFIIPRAKPEHVCKTNGDPAVPLSGDKSKIAKTERLEKAEAEFRARLEATFRECFDPPPRPKPKRRIPARKNPWPKGRKFQQRKETT